MARKQKHTAHENHERWLVSYADFITLLFAFFVVMFASSQTDKTKAKAMSESVQRALEESRVAPLIQSILGGTVDDKGKGNAMLKGPGGAQKAAHEARDLALSLDFLHRELKPEIEAGKMQVTLEARGLVVSLKQAAFFPSGEDAIAPEMVPSLEKIAAAIRQLPNAVRLEGHTDSVPINNHRFRSNWDLSAARGIAMLDLLTQRCRIPPERLAVAGYADTVPITTNDTEAGRAQNRRVDVVILHQDGAKSEPKPAP